MKCVLQRVVGNLAAAHFLPASSSVFGITGRRCLAQTTVETPITETIRTFLPTDVFYNMLQERKMDFYTGVPDSLLKDICAYVSDTAPAERHVIAANEGAAVAIAAGYHLATNKFPVVYMQNSGIGNALNPLMSLAAAKIYSIPMLLLIGWRGEPGKRDEPQHMLQGKATANLLTDMNIPFEVLPDFDEGAEEALDTARSYLHRRRSPYAFLVKRQTFAPYKLKNIPKRGNFSMSREDAIESIITNTKEWDIVVSTTGFASRELYELRDKMSMDHKRDFLTVGSMGHSSAIGLGIAMAKPTRNVICLDGDGAALMHMGTLATIGKSSARNIRHILLNNGVHDSVGGQPTVGLAVDFPSIAKSCGYKQVISVESKDELAKSLQALKDSEGPVLLEVKVRSGARNNLGRPKTSPLQNKRDFMAFLEQ